MTEANDPFGHSGPTRLRWQRPSPQVLTTDDHRSQYDVQELV